MKFKAKLSMKFLTDAEDDEPKVNNLLVDSSINNGYKTYLSSKHKHVKKLKKCKRRKRY